jgi:hypothetical protein
VVTDGDYAVTVTGPQTYTFTDAGVDVSELAVGATSRAAGAWPGSPTFYRLRKLGVNNLVRIEHVSGSSPQFTACGVAVDDYIVIQGTTFSASNSGTYRVVAVDNTSVIFEHDGAVDDLDMW